MATKRLYYEYGPYAASILPQRNQNVIWYQAVIHHEASGKVVVKEEFTTPENAISYLATRYNLLQTEWKDLTVA